MTTRFSHVNIWQQIFYFRLICGIKTDTIAVLLQAIADSNGFCAWMAAKVFSMVALFNFTNAVQCNVREGLIK